MSAATPAAASSRGRRNPPERLVADQRPGNEERRRGDGDEIPVDVDQRMDREGRQDESKRELVASAPPRPAQQEAAGRDEEHEPDHACLREELQRQAVRLGGLVEIRVAEAQIRQVERARPGAGELVAPPTVERLTPPDRAEVRGARAEAPGAVADR